MPFGMSGYIQSVVMQRRVYIGGGDAGRGSANNYIVVMYDTCSGDWDTLPRYGACDFAMVTINNQLLLVGGCENGDESKLLGVWEANRREWVHPYPDKPTASSRCSALVYNNRWLVVAGGWADGQPLSSVEVLESDSKQWYTCPPAPIAWYNTKSVLIGDTGYFMGGHAKSGSAIKSVYHINLEALISHVTSEASSLTGRHRWKEISGLQTTRSTPLSVNGSLLAIGGLDKDRRAVTAIHLYQPDSGKWLKVGDLPFPRYYCTCGMLTEKDMIVAGGFLNDRLNEFDIALIQTT